MPALAQPGPPGRIELPYTEVAPPADLAAYVDRFWLRTTHGGDPARRHRVLPDGCVDLIVDLRRGAAEVVGAMTRALEVPAGPAELVAVRFSPGTAAAIAGCALAELTDRHAEVAALGIAGGALVGRVHDAPRAQGRIAVLVEWLRRRLAGAAPPDPLVARAVARLSSADAPRVDQLARELAVTRQHLARAFRREVGITPKELARIARMQRAAAALGRGRVELARLAVELGYFDQAHLANELRALVGITPAGIAAERPVALAHLYPR
ncbi:MAG TPA: helix-turn-helix transcriptional regulator [Kofleriaceae bacterium]|nr:helix-turn-helix transcriptional regulator [Kofleriaceae bacterium]